MVGQVKKRTEFKITSERFKGGSRDQVKSRIRKARVLFKELVLDPWRVS